jgi:hypothetical protein
MSSWYRGPAAAVMVCGGPLNATMLATTRGTLSELLPVTSDVLSLSTLIGARTGTAGDALTV